jgi:hypothetical protein
MRSGIIQPQLSNDCSAKGRPMRKASRQEDEPSLGDLVGDPVDGVGIAIRLVGILVMVFGLSSLLFGIYILFKPNPPGPRAIFGALGVGAFCVGVGFTWASGKRFFATSCESPGNDTLSAGRAGMFDKWPKMCQRIIDRLRPALLAQRAVFFSEDKEADHEDRKVRIGWPGVWSSDYAVMAVLRPYRNGGLELSLRVGTMSNLLIPEGPLKPRVEGIAPRVPGFGAVVLSSEDFPSEVLDWIAIAGQLTRRKARKQIMF